MCSHQEAQTRYAPEFETRLRALVAHKGNACGLRPLRTYRMASGLASSIPAEACEIPVLNLRPFPSPTEARLVSPSARDVVVSRVPRLVHADQSLELELAAAGLGADAGAAVTIASWISAHALLQIAVDIPGQAREEVSVPVKARPSGGGCIIRALVRPSAWTDAASVTVVSLLLAGRPLPCESLPVPLLVGYNHTPAPEGAVVKAAKAGDVTALWAAIEAGGSTEEADEVCGGERGGPWESDEENKSLQTQSPPAPSCITLSCRTATLPCSWPLATATSRPSARSLRQAPTRPQQTR